MTVSNRQSVGIIGGVLLSTSALVGCGSSAPGADALPTISFEKYTLANGLEVVLSEDHRLPLVAIDIWYHVGPANEVAGRTGFAHLFEHMMFQGSKHVPGDAHFRLIEAAGGTTVNGTTGFDRTNYFETLPSNQLELGLWLESDRMGFLLDTVDEQKLANQQDVVRNERRQSVENRPYGLAGEALFHAIFPEGHPYYASVIGSHADIQAARLEDVKDFFKQYYAPNNASLAIVGDFDPGEVRPLVEQYFGDLRRGPDVPPVSVTTPSITSERRVVVEDRIELPRVYMAWLTPAFFEPGDADADAAASALGGGASSRLYKALVYEKQIAQSVSAFQQSMALGSVFQIVATVRPDRTVEEVEAAIDEELARFRENGPDQREIEQARNTFETDMVQGLEVLGGFGGVADTLNMFNHYVGDPGHLPAYIDEHRQVSPESVRTFVQDYLDPGARVVLHVVPGEPDLGPAVPTPPPPTTEAGAGAEVVNVSEPWRAEAPQPGPSRPMRLAPVSSFTLANGLTVIHQTRPGMPVATASLAVKSGGDTNPVSRPGLANFTAAMLDQGTASRTASEVADDVAHLGASLNTSSSKDLTTVTVGALARNFAAALEIAADVALHPTFPADEVERQRASRQGSLAAARQNPGTVASSAATLALYGPEHPYAYNELGTPESVAATTREDLAGFWEQTFVPPNAALVVASPMSDAELRPLVEDAFAAWTGDAAPELALGEPETTDARVVVVDVPGAPQTQLLVTTLGAARDAPDYASIEVMNAVLGGLFSSRINLNLREEHGYTYGARSQFLLRKTPGPFWVASGVRTDVTAAAVGEIIAEIRTILEEPVTDDELRLARDAIVNSLPSDFETGRGTVGTLSGLFVYDLGLDYYTRLPGEVMAVTAENVRETARRYLAPGDLIVVAVGDRTAIEPGLRGLGLGRIEVREP